MIGRAMVHNDTGFVRGQVAGQNVLDQTQYEVNSTVGNSTLTVSSLLAGVVQRTGPTAGYTDTLPTVDQLVAAVPTLGVGDSFEFSIRNTVAFLLTMAAGTGWSLSPTIGSTVNVAASSVRDYVVTINSTARSRTFSASTTNGSAVLTNVSETDAKNLQPGQLVTGTGIPANTTILGVNLDNLTVTLSANATATGNNIAVTSSPTATLDSIRVASL